MKNLRLFCLISAVCIGLVFLFVSNAATANKAKDNGFGMISGSQLRSSISGTYTGSVRQYLSDKKGQLTIAITSIEKVTSGFYYLGGTVTLSGFSSCFTHGSFSKQTYWGDSSLTIIAEGAGFSQAFLDGRFSSDFTQILIDLAHSGFKDSGGSGYCLLLDKTILTKQGATTTTTTTTSTTTSTTTTSTSTSATTTTTLPTIPTEPSLTLTTSGITVTASWSSVMNAIGYTLFYAPYPYTGPDSIGSVEMGSQTDASFYLWRGAAFYVATQAYNGVGNSGYSNIEYFIIGSSISVIPTMLSLAVGETGACNISNGMSPYSASSSNASVGTVSVSGSTLSVAGVSAGSATIKVSDSAGDLATVSVTVTGGTPATYTNSLGQKFILLPAGAFTMGSPSDEPGRDSDEGPQHTVTLTQPFYMQNTEVTQAQWEAVMGNSPSLYSGCPTCPVEMVSWDDVQTFISRMNARGEGMYDLPTEAEWEYAARAGSSTAFYNGGITSYSDMYDCNYDPNLNAIGWYCYNLDFGTYSVAQKTPNAWGLYDMSGNVREWCRDWHSGSYYDSGAMTDPTGPASGLFRVIRGGGYYAEDCRSANRSGFRPGNRIGNLGFRLLRYPFSVISTTKPPKTGQTTCYDADGNVISCVGTGQDGDMEAGVAWPVPRFMDNGDGTVTDQLTGLMWTKAANIVQRTWREAFDYVAGMNAGTYENFGYTGWRVPNIKEIESLIDAGQHNPALPSNHPFVSVQGATGNYVFWSSTTESMEPEEHPSDTANTMKLDTGDFHWNNVKTNSNSIWPVRSEKLGVIQLPKTGQTTCWDTEGNTISCNGTGQDGDLRVGVSWPDPRFTDNGDGTVTDNLTSLIWTKDTNPPDVKLTWQKTLDYIAGMNKGIHQNFGYTDWRLPNRKEFQSLADYQWHSSFPVNHPFTNVGGYHTSTSKVGNPVYAWSYSGGEVHCRYDKSYEQYAWPVRGGQVE